MQVGVIEGNVDTSSFKFRATEKVGKFDFVSVKSNDKWILAQVDTVTKHNDGETTAKANIIGYRDKGLTRAPRHVIDPDSIIYKADQELISDTLGLDDKGLRVGHLETNPDIDIMVDPDDFYKHFAVLAQTGAGKCVTPDTNVLLSNGCPVSIKEIFESSSHVVKKGDDEELRILNDCSVKALNESYEFVDADAIYAYRKRAEKVFEINTSSGRKIEVTPEHPLMVAEEEYSFIESGELEEGQHIAVPRKISTSAEENWELSEALKSAANKEAQRRENSRKEYSKFRTFMEQGKPISEIEADLDVPRSTIENWKYQENQPNENGGMALSVNAKGIDVPETFTPELAEFLSLVAAEGAEQKEGSYRIIFTNNNERLMQRFEILSSTIFGLETGKMEENARYIDSITLKHVLEDLGYKTLQKSDNKEIPDIVAKSSEKSKRTFLKTFYDCEGCMEDHEITLSSASKQIINAISYMLLEFGIVARISSREKQATNSSHEGDTYYRLSISGVKQMEKFSKEIGFGIKRKQDKLETYIEQKDYNTNSDIIPVDGEYLKKERQKLEMSQREVADSIGSHSTLVSLYERNKRRPSREKFSAMAETLDSQLYTKLSESDLFWDKIDSIKEKDHSGYVYDLTVREHHNFVAGTGGVVSHNSYLTGVLIEEMLEADFPVLVLDPHGEYSSLGLENPDSDEARRYDYKEFSPNTDINREAMPLSFSSVNLDKKELMTLIPDSLTNSQMGVLYNSLKRLREKDEDYNLLDIQDAVSQEDSTAKWNLLNYLEQLDDSGLFSENPVDLKNLVEPGRATIINLKAVEPEPTEMTAYMLAKKLFDLRKKNRIPPFIMVIEEAHNFVPEKGFGQAVSNPIMRKIASEGRKFGLGIGVISQRPARIDKNVLSQANTQFILRVTNPNDLKAISKSFEGVTSEVESMIKSLPPGVSFLLGNDYPVMTDVRTRKSMHGGETQTSETYVEKTDVKLFKPGISVQEVESMYDEKFSTAYYPLYLVENEKKRLLVDGVNGDVKAKRRIPSGLEKKVLRLLRNDKGKSEIVEELDLSVSKAASKIDSLEDKGLVEDGEVEESILDKDVSDEAVNAEDLIEFEVSEEEVRDRFSGEVSEVRYPYYRSEDKVYDPILGEEI